MVPGVGFIAVLGSLVLGSLVAGSLVPGSTVETQQPRFASATIRPSTMSAGERSVARVEPNGDYTAMNVTLVQLLEAAYRRSLGDRREIIDGPEWVRTERFDLYATHGGEPVLDADGFPRQSLRMLQELLRERFRLEADVELQDRQALRLIAAGAQGSGLARSTIDCAEQARARARKEQIQGPPCGAAPYPGRLVARGASMSDLAALISPWVGKPVVDHTGIAGSFDIDLEGVEFKPPGPFGPSLRPSTTKDSIARTIRPQLGLELQPAIVPIEVLVIRHAERPALAQPEWRDPSPHVVRFVHVEPSVKLEVLDWGGSGRPLVFVSCYLTGHAYDEIAPKLTDRFRVFGFTRRGFGASDRPAGGYELQRAADDLLAVLDALKLEKPILAANSCGGWTVTLLAVQHPDRLGGLAYLEAADDPMLTLADFDFPPVDEANLPKRIERPALDHSSFDAFRRTQKARTGVAFPEAELRYLFGVKPDGSLGPDLMPPDVRRAVTTGNRSQPDFARVRVPVLALFQTPAPFDEAAKEYVIENEMQRAALRQREQVGLIMARRWSGDLRAAVPSAKIVEIPGASLYMFLSHEGDVIRELVAFAATLPPMGARQ